MKEGEIKTSVEFLTAEAAVSRIPDKSRMMVGGFGRTGTPEHLLQAVIDNTEIDGLTIISNNINETSNLHHLFMQGRIRKAIGSYYTTSKEVVKAYREGHMDIELIPQGTLSEALRLGGSGIPAFYTPTSAGTELAKDKESRVFNGREYVLEKSLTAEIALIKAHKADKAGNLIYRKSARNFNPLMAMAADLTIVEVEEIVELGELDPEEIITPFIFVDIVVERGKDND
ncbi:CoA transferase subunit A [Oceanobacillus bengalensis]|uniref:3-oxoacid CoA-transferase subunit A n=1 Tax=Oceanobacillus bengalensis TaxID=1435466 RepID=A0A494Z2W6_9BACI|nr:3-oxoacid CoA-transferase subunit A [Oceanobacillus bengalensis]RKQ16638.1 3-oxoacid CoA-transferase subunit A [Oceanobacillus bengalensis]